MHALILFQPMYQNGENIKMRQWDSHLLHKFKVKNKHYVNTLDQVGCGCNSVDKGAAGAAFTSYFG